MRALLADSASYEHYLGLGYPHQMYGSMYRRVQMPVVGTTAVLVFQRARQRRNVGLFGNVYSYNYSSTTDSVLEKTEHNPP